MSSLKLVILMVLAALAVHTIQAQSPLTLLSNVQINFANNGTHTQFTVTSPLGNGVALANSYLAVGVNYQPSMFRINIIQILV